MKPEELQARMYPKKPTPEPKVEEKEPPETPAQEQTEMEQENPHPINLLAARVFAAINAAHRKHLEPSKGFGSDAEHRALEYFYTNVRPAIDYLIEVDQGLYGLIGDYTIEDVKPTDMASYIRAEGKWINLNRTKFSECEAMWALVDDITAIYFHTAYKLTNLK